MTTGLDPDRIAEIWIQVNYVNFWLNYYLNDEGDMKSTQIKQGMIVYHKTWVHCGKGIVLGLECDWNTRIRCANVDFEGMDDVGKYPIRDLAATPNTERIEKMHEAFQARGQKSSINTNGDRLVLPREKE